MKQFNYTELSLMYMSVLTRIEQVKNLLDIEELAASRESYLKELSDLQELKDKLSLEMSKN